MSGAGGDGLQLQARTARGSGRGGGYVCTAAHRFYVPALQRAPGWDTSRVRVQHNRGVREENNRRGTPGVRTAIGGVRQLGIARHKKALADCTRPSANTKPSISSSLLSTAQSIEDGMTQASFHLWRKLSEI